MSKNCRNCKKNFITLTKYYILCEDCRINNKTKKCKTCYNEFTPKKSYYVICENCNNNKVCGYCNKKYNYNGENSELYCNHCSHIVYCKCIKCDNKYDSYKNKIINKICDECVKDIPETNCIVCDKKYYNINCTMKCEECKHKHEYECNVCNDKYWAKWDYPYSQNDAIRSYDIKYCYKCYETLQKITSPSSYDKLNEEIDLNYNVKVDYIKDNPHHDGYCSDPGEITRTESYKMKLYPYYKKYPITNIDEYGEINNIYEGNILLYHKVNDGCGIGSGYCGTEKVYKITSAYLVKK